MTTIDERVTAVEDQDLEAHPRERMVFSAVHRAETRQGFIDVNARLDTLAADVAGIKGDVAGIKTGLATLQAAVLARLPEPPV